MVTSNHKSVIHYCFVVLQSENKKKRGRRKRDRLLDEKLTDTSSSEAEEQWKKLQMKKRIQSSDS